MSLVGRWRIAEMELWAQEDVDLVGLGFIAFDRDHTGSLGFIAVEGGLDWREVSRDGPASSPTTTPTPTRRAAG